MSDDDRSCPSCGARVPAADDQCNLCGTPVGADESGSSEEEPDASEDSAHAEAPLDEETISEETSDERSEAATEDPTEGEEHTSVYCHQCGFENPIEANYCSKCGTQLQDLSSGATRPVAADLPAGNGGTSGSDGSEPEPVSDEEKEDPQAEMRSQLLRMVGIGVVLVVGLFFVTQWSQQYEWGDGEAASSAPAAENEAAPSGPRTSGGEAGPSGEAGPASGGSPRMGSNAGSERSTADLESLTEELGSPLEGPIIAEADSLRDEMEGAPESEQRAVQSELVQLYTNAGAPGRAALVQQKVADATEAIGDRRRMADLLYRWMQRVAQQQDRSQSAKIAQHVASAYEAVVEQRPEDLDARTRMGEAYLLTNNPMKGIRAINDVLEDDSTFVPARFQKGLALLQISRLDEAVQQFEMVKTFADADEPFYQQAERAVEVIRERMSNQDNQAVPDS